MSQRRRTPSPTVPLPPGQGAANCSHRYRFARLRSALILLALCLLATPSSLACDKSSQREDENKPPREELAIAGETFRLELAKDPAARAKGLSGRESIARDGGMLFIFPDERRRWFWMKDCLVDIDLAFLDSRGRIVALHRMKAEPPQGDREPQWHYEQRLRSHPSRRPARFALEFRTGTLDRLDLRVGEVIEDLDLDRLKQLAEPKPQRRRSNP